MVTLVGNDKFYDAIDHFSDDDFDDEQAPDDDISNMLIYFHPLSVWNNSEDNRVEYVLPPGYGKISSKFLLIVVQKLIVVFKKLTAVQTGSVFTGKITRVLTSISVTSTQKPTVTSLLHQLAP